MNGRTHGEARNGTGGGVPDRAPLPTGRAHLGALAGALATLEADADRVDRWGRHLAGVLVGGGRLLAVGNGGSAALAQHLTSELVGRYRDDRAAFSALALHAEGSSLTSITNDYGADEAFARQVRAHGRPGDVLVALSTSGSSSNVLAAVEAARACGMTTWALTGRRSNPLADGCDDAVCVEAPATATVQEIHQVVVHLLCAAVDCEVGASKDLSTGLPARLRPEQRPEPRPGAQAPGAAPVARPSVGAGPTSEAADGLSVVVVGDVLLDRDVEGRVERLAPDAPVPVVDEEARRARPGGAGLAAALAAADGHRVSLVTAIAGDPAGRELAALLSEAGVEVLNLGLDAATPEKVRVLAGGRSLLRLDRGGRGNSPEAVGPLTAAAREAFLSADAVLVADYGRGVTARGDLRSALAEVAPRVPVVWDPHPRGSEPVPGVRLATPNRSEAEKLVPPINPVGNPGDGLAAVARGAFSLAARWNAGGVAVTLGAGGALLVEGGEALEGGRPFVVPAPPVEGGDPCGAGDRFASRAAGLLAGGAALAQAVSGAVAAASGFVAAGGAAAVRIGGSDSCVGYLSKGSFADAGPEDAEEVVARVRARGGTVVATGGCFDLLHAGHVHTLRAARSLGDCLVVCLNSDASVRRLKGADRPLVPEEDRADVLRALQCVDAVVLFDEETPEAVLERLRPDVFAKGGDYAMGDLPEAGLLARWGGRAAILPYVDGRSTTRLIEEAVSRGAR